MDAQQHCWLNSNAFARHYATHIVNWFNVKSENVANFNGGRMVREFCLSYQLEMLLRHKLIVLVRFCVLVYFFFMNQLLVSAVVRLEVETGKSHSVGGLSQLCFRIFHFSSADFTAGWLSSHKRFSQHVARLEHEKKALHHQLKLRPRKLLASIHSRHFKSSSRDAKINKIK